MINITFALFFNLICGLFGMFQIILGILWIYIISCHNNVMHCGICGHQRLRLESMTTKSNSSIKTKSSDPQIIVDISEAQTDITPNTANHQRTKNLNNTRAKGVFSLPYKSKLYTTVSILSNALFCCWIIGYYAYDFFANAAYVVICISEHIFILKIYCVPIVCRLDQNYSGKRTMRILYGLVFVHLGKLFLHMYYLHRMKGTFNNSAYSISNKYYNNAVVLLFTSFIIFCISIYSINILGNETGYFELTQLIFTIEYIIGAIIDTFWGSILLALFLNRMKSIMKANKQMITNSDVNKGAVKTQRLYRYVTSKLTILYIVMFITSIIAFILTSINTLYFGIILIDCFINSICLLLSFKFFSVSYKNFCFLCRFCCELNQ